jgi:copper chaperone CopZ
MEKITLNVEKMFCEECSLALRRFIGHMEGVESIDVEAGKVAIAFDEAKITGEELFRITRDNIEKLGYKMGQILFKEALSVSIFCAGEGR